MPQSFAKANSLVALLGVAVCLCTSSALARGEDPLPSWRDGERKAAITDFVAQATDSRSAGFVPPAQRIATFDNDGTLWAEQPLYFQLFFILDRIRELAPEHPEWQDEEPFASVLKGDLESALASGNEGLLAMSAATQTGMSTAVFKQMVSDWIETARHPTTDRPFTEMVYQPMLEMLEYLRSNGFKTYIVSGGGIEFMRAWAESVYGIPPEQVIGTRTRTAYEISEGKPTIMRLPEIDFIDDREGKPLGINQHIGRRPVMAFGNSDGDFQMLEWTTSGEGSRLGVIIHHTDADREWAYDRESSIGHLERGLDEGPDRGWVIVDMASDWEAVFRAETR